MSVQQQAMASVRGHRQGHRERGVRALWAVVSPHTVLTVHNDGEQAVEEGLQPLVPAGDDLVKDLWKEGALEQGSTLLKAPSQPKPVPPPH